MFEQGGGQAERSTAMIADVDIVALEPAVNLHPRFA
jgi:hypothetical protein